MLGREGGRSTHHPTPRGFVRNPRADDGPNNGAEDRGEGVDGDGLASMFSGEAVANHTTADLEKAYGKEEQRC